MDQKTIDQVVHLLKQYRQTLVMSFAPVDSNGVPELRTLVQSTDPLEIAAVNDIALLDAVIDAMPGR